MILCVLSFTTIAQSLSGTYTIGGVNPDYTTFNIAVQDLNINGISGDVIFNVRPGIYIEQITINEFTGSGSYAVTFQSENGNTKKTVLRHNHAGYNTAINYTLKILGGDNICFKNLTIQANKEFIHSGSGSKVIKISNNSDNISLINNNIISWLTQSNNDENDCIHFDGINNSITVTGNVIIGGGNGIRLRGIYPNIAENWKIENNYFNMQGESAIKVSNGYNIKISGNRIENSHSYNLLSTGIGLESMKDSINIINNFIHLSSSGMGISVNNMADSVEHSFIANNIIIVEPYTANFLSHDPVGIRLSGTDSVVVAYNAVLMNNDTTIGHCIKSENNNKIRLVNNQLYHKGGGLCYFTTNNSNGNFSSDYNNIYNGNDTIAIINGNSYIGISNLNSGLNTDLNSISIQPYFIQDTVLISMNPGVYETGTPIGSINTDYYQNNRSNLSPDIGIYEGSVANIDAAILSTNLTDEVICPNDSVSVYATLINYGATNLDSVTISYGTTDSVFSTISWTGNLNQFETDTSVYIGTFLVTKQDTLDLIIYTHSPNGQLDGFHQNDTLKFHAKSSLNGNYTIGNDTTDFNTITDAANYLMQYGVCGPVIFNIIPGNYQDQISLTKIKGASDQNTITFQSQEMDSSSVTISLPSTYSNFFFQLYETDHIRFRHLKFNANNSVGSFILVMSSNDLQISNCEFHYQGTNFVTQIYFTGNALFQTKDLIIEKNLFVGGKYQIRVIGGANALYDNVLIQNNVFESLYTNPITISYTKNIQIIRNLFTGKIDDEAIHFKHCFNDLNINKNQFKISTNGTGTLKIENCEGTNSHPIEIKNNFFSTISEYGDNSLDIHYSSNLNIYNNNFNMESSMNSFGLHYFGTLSNINIYNNIFRRSSFGYFQSLSSLLDTTNFNSDYNAYYSDEVFQTFSSGNTPSINNQFWSSDLDQHSFMVDPQYISSEDLHINNSTLLIGAGKIIPGLTEDIDGETRPSPPTIGADEFSVDSLNYFDLQLVGIVSPDSSKCTPPDSIFKIAVYNNSNFDIHNFDISWYLFNDQKDSIHFLHTIVAGATDTIAFNAINLTGNTKYDLDFAINHPNGQTDNDQFNNWNWLNNYYYFKDFKIYSKQSTVCSTDTELYIKTIPNSSVLWSTGSTQNKITVSSPGTYSVTVTHHNGCTVTDSLIVL